MEKTNVPYAVSASADRSRYYMGGLWTFLARGKDTNGTFAMIECRVRKGIEPPAHTHTYEDEGYYLVEGEVQFIVGDREYSLKGGDYIYLPKNIPHQFKVQSDTARFLLKLVPAGLDDFFWELSRPADKLEMPPLPAGPPPPEVIERIKTLQQKFGIVGMDNSRLKTS